MKQMTFDLLGSPTAGSEGLRYDPTVTKLETIQRTTTDAVLIRLIDSLYSADKIRPYSKTKIGYAKGYVELEGRLWCCTACGGNATVSVDEVLPGTYPDMPKDIRYSYSGETITIRGKLYTFTYRRMHMKYIPPATLPTTLYIADKPGMIELSRCMSLGAFDRPDSWPSIIDLLGRRWLIYEADLSLATQARLQLVRVEIRNNHDTDPIKIPPERMGDNPYVGRIFTGHCCNMTVMLDRLTVTCPGTFYATRKSWIKAMNYMPGDDEEDFADDEADEDLDEDAGDEDLDEAAPTATPPARRNTANKQPSSQLKQQTFF